MDQNKKYPYRYSYYPTPKKTSKRIVKNVNNLSRMLIALAALIGVILVPAMVTSHDIVPRILGVLILFIALGTIIGLWYDEKKKS